ncbi:ribosome silencing factor [Roseateles koreensis]|uniref:Ribosomal silencing factor RsfS n=1 Tax=Roseateles koreensis TaxID=2987526 RepID=A0ABT5KNB1_9BURK|nr:ribosome silencing factor [Roseateles koreensis]MDC8784332.1 ribosome silencing factor [Roseateles koreensis]
MDIRKLQRAIVDGLEDVKAQNIVVFNTEHLSPLFERVIIASGTSNRQTKALASSVRVTVKERGMDVLRCEGEENGEWIIVDCGAAVVHVMQPSIRDYYHLEEIWGGKPVNMKMSDGETKLVKASEDDAPKKKATAKKAASATSAKEEALKGPVKLPAKKAAPKKAATGEAKPAAKKVVAKKGVTRTVGVKTPVDKTIKVGQPKPATKKAATKSAAKSATKPAAKPAVKSAAKPVAAKKVAAKTPAAAKKAPAKKTATRG